MQKVLIKFDQSSYESSIESLDNLKSNLENIISSYKALGISDFTTSDFCSLVFETEKFLFNKFMDNKLLEIGGVKVTKEKYFEIAAKPPGYFALISETKKLIENIEQQVGRLKAQDGSVSIYNHRSVREIISFFDFESDGSLFLKTAIIEKCKALYEMYAETDNAIRAFHLSSKICELLNSSGIFGQSPYSNKNKREMEKIMECIKVTDNTNSAAQVDINKVKYFS